MWLLSRWFLSSRINHAHFAFQHSHPIVDPNPQETKALPGPYVENRFSELLEEQSGVVMVLVEHQREQNSSTEYKSSFSSELNHLSQQF